jgi:DNA polymerase elongation subunit (family B)
MYLLDVQYNRQDSQITCWIKNNDRYQPVSETYYPDIYTTGDPELRSLISTLPGVVSATFETKITHLSGAAVPLIKIKLKNTQMIYEMAGMLEERGCMLYNIDLDPARQYMLGKGIFPMANMEADERYSLDYEIPGLKVMELCVKPQKQRGIISMDEPIGSITLGENTIQGNENDLICELSRQISKEDPDIIVTDGGDSFDIPYLYRRAGSLGISFAPGRSKNIAPGKDRSYFSYGRILYKPQGHIFSGRLHLDRASFMFREGGLSGLIDLSRITGIPMQELSRLSPGGAVNAMQVNQAMLDGVLVPWKRNIAENWKTALELMVADRGALVIEPRVGLHENAAELDFASLFPNIMVNHNISPETVLCPCCTDSKKRVPFTGYNICEKQLGLIPRVIKPLIERRMAYKKRIIEQPEKAEEYEKKQNLLKWLLVTSFGYMGYNKARFGRIECHESITAYGREILLQTIELAEGMGFEILHGIVDSLWVKGNDPQELCRRASERIGITLEHKGVFKWIVFLPNRSNGTGALNRYYGVMNNGKLKVRGIEMRRSDTPALINRMQEEMLSCLAKADDTSGFFCAIPEALKVLREYSRKVFEGECKIEDMIFTARISQSLKNYRQSNNNTAAMRQFQKEGITIQPGQSIRYVITDSASKSYMKRVKIAELVDEDTGYDRSKYNEFLLRAAESILLPFGYTKERLDGLMHNRGLQMDLGRWQSSK